MRMPTVSEFQSTPGRDGLGDESIASRGARPVGFNPHRAAMGPAMGYGGYRLISHWFQSTPGRDGPGDTHDQHLVFWAEWFQSTPGRDGPGDVPTCRRPARAVSFNPHR